MIRIVPAPRLLWLAAIVGVPFLTALGFGSRAAYLPLPFLAAAACLAVWDAQRGRAHLAKLGVSLPKRINLFMGRPAEIDLRLSNPARTKRRVRVGLNFPRELKSE